MSTRIPVEQCAASDAGHESDDNHSVDSAPGFRRRYKKVQVPALLPSQRAVLIANVPKVSNVKFW